MAYLETTDAELYYEVAGEGTPFVMIHAGIAHSAMWDPQFEKFAQNYRVIRFDQRGFGKTVTHTKRFNRRDDVLALMDHLGVERAILMGCSMGGSLALDFTLEHPERVMALILIDSGASGMQAPDELKAQWAEQDAAFEAGDIERMLELELQLWVDGPGRAPGSGDSAVREKVRAMELDNLKIDTDGYELVPLEPPAVGRLKELRVPTLVIVGEADVPFTVETGHMMAREIPNARLVVVKDTAHVPSMERTGEVDAAIETFLRSI